MQAGLPIHQRLMVHPPPVRDQQIVPISLDLINTIRELHNRVPGVEIQCFATHLEVTGHPGIGRVQIRNFGNQVRPNTSNIPYIRYVDMTGYRPPILFALCTRHYRGDPHAAAAINVLLASQTTVCKFCCSLHGSTNCAYLTTLKKMAGSHSMFSLHLKAYDTAERQDRYATQGGLQAEFRRLAQFAKKR